MSIKIKDCKTNEINFYCPNTGKCVRTMEFFEYVGKNASEIIEYNEISERFAVLFDYFSVTVGSFEGKNNTFDISIHFTYSGDLNDKREEYLNRFISYIFERFNVPEKYTYIIEKLIEKHF